MNNRLQRNGDTSVIEVAISGALLFLGTTGWMLYKFNVMRKVRKGLREQTTAEEVALLAHMRNGAIITFAYSLSCVSFMHVGLSRLTEDSAQYYSWLHAIEFLIGICIAAGGLAVACHLLHAPARARLKQRVRVRARLQVWTARFWQSMEKVRRRNLVKHD